MVSLQLLVEEGKKGQEKVKDNAETRRSQRSTEIRRSVRTPWSGTAESSR